MINRFEDPLVARPRTATHHSPSGPLQDHPSFKEFVHFHVAAKRANDNWRAIADGLSDVSASSLHSQLAFPGRRARCIEMETHLAAHLGVSCSRIGAMYSSQLISSRSDGNAHCTRRCRSSTMFSTCRLIRATASTPTCSALCGSRCGFSAPPLLPAVPIRLFASLRPTTYLCAPAACTYACPTGR